MKDYQRFLKAPYQEKTKVSLVELNFLLGCILLSAILLALEKINKILVCCQSSTNMENMESSVRQSRQLFRDYIAKKLKCGSDSFEQHSTLCAIKDVTANSLYHIDLPTLIKYRSQSFDESIDQEVKRLDQDSTYTIRVVSGDILYNFVEPMLIKYGSQSFFNESIDEEKQQLYFIPDVSKSTASNGKRIASNRYFRRKDKYYIERFRAVLTELPEDNEACNTSSEFDRDYLEAKLYCEISEEFDRGKSFEKRWIGIFQIH